MTDEHRIPIGEGIEPISLDDGGIIQDPPALPGEVIALKDPDEVLARLARDIVDHALQCVRKFGDFHIALSGGRTPFPLYTRLMTDPLYRALPWAKTHLWIVDERRVALFPNARDDIAYDRVDVLRHFPLGGEECGEVGFETGSGSVEA